MERTPLLEAEIEAPCVEGNTHGVRVALYGWGEFEVVWNPCEESLGVFGALAPCQGWLSAPNRFESQEFVPQRLALVEQLVKLGTDAVPHLIQALQDRDEEVRKASVEALGNIQDPQAISPPSSKPCKIATGASAKPVQRRWATFKTHKPSHTSSKHCKIAMKMSAKPVRKRWRKSVNPRSHPSSKP